MKPLFALLLCILIVSDANSQLLDLIRIEYTTVPAQSADFEFQRKRFMVNYPIKLKEEGTYLFVGLDYSSIDLEFKDNVNTFDRTQTDDFSLLDVNIVYTTPVDENWRFAARIVPGFSSNLEGKNLLFEDMFLSGAMVFIKDKKEAPGVPKPYRVILGMAYSGTSGIIFPIPFVSYYKKFHPKWSYNLGVPTTNLQFHASEKVRFKVLGQIDGFTSNLQDELLVNNDGLAERLRMSLILVGLRYEFKIAKNIEFYLNTTRSLQTRIQFRASNRNTILQLDKNKVFHFSSGIRLKI